MSEPTADRRIVEKIARAMWTDFHRAFCVTGVLTPWQRIPEDVKGDYRLMAHAALRVIERERRTR